MVATGVGDAPGSVVAAGDVDMPGDPGVTLGTAVAAGELLGAPGEAGAPGVCTGDGDETVMLATGVADIVGAGEEPEIGTGVELTAPYGPGIGAGRPAGVGAEAAGDLKGGGGGLRPVPPTPCSPLGLGEAPGLGLPGVLGDTPGLTPGTVGDGPEVGGDESYGVGPGEGDEAGEEDTPGVAVGLAGADGFAAPGGAGTTKGAGGGWGIDVEAGVTAGAGALAARHLAQVIWQ